MNLFALIRRLTNRPRRIDVATVNALTEAINDLTAAVSEVVAVLENLRANPVPDTAIATITEAAATLRAAANPPIV